MAFRLHSRLVAWNLLLVLVLSIFLAFFLNSAQLALVIIVAVSLTFMFGYGVRVIVARPLRRIPVVSRKLAAGHLEQRLPITGDEEIATIGTSLNAMVQTLSEKTVGSRFYETNTKRRLTRSRDLIVTPVG